MMASEVVEMYCGASMSIPQIAEALSVPPSRVRTQLLAEGVELRSRAEGIRLRSEHLSERRRGATRPHSEEAKANIKAAAVRRGERDARGTSVKDGYIVYTRGPHKGRSVHVLLMEERLGRPLRDDEEVHHIDENRSNNAPDNLALVTKAGHQRLHRLQDAMRGRSRERDGHGQWR